MTDGERQKGDGGRDFCNRQAPSNNLLPGLAVVAWPSFGLVADANQAHRGDTDARALTKTRHDQNNQPKTSAPGRADELISFWAGGDFRRGNG